jgi:hypothetical protein
MNPVEVLLKLGLLFFGLLLRTPTLAARILGGAPLWLFLRRICRGLPLGKAGGLGVERIVSPCIPLATREGITQRHPKGGEQESTRFVIHAADAFGQQEAVHDGP